MDSLFCPSQYFVNKQNVRSYNNVVHGKLLKNGADEEFLKNILQECDLVSGLTLEIRKTLIEFKENIKRNGSDDFKKYFQIYPNEEQKLVPVSKDNIISSCLYALNKIIPNTFFGNNHNMKIFNKLIQQTIFSMKGENIDVKKILVKWNYDIGLWKEIENRNQILQYILIWILKFLLAPMISSNFYATTCKLSADENKLFYFHKNEWQRFYDKNIARMTKSNIIEKYHENCIGKQVKRKLSFTEYLRLKLLKQKTPKLCLVLKGNQVFRPIVRYKYEQNSLEKKKMKERLYFLKVLTGKSQPKLETNYLKLYNQWKFLGKPKLYFVKTDLTNAFGSVDKDKLMKILALKHLEFQKNEKDVHLKKKVAQMYKDFVSELRNPLLVRAGSTVYEWKKGLVQGYKYSPALSELYYSFLDKEYFSSLLEKSETQIKFLTRAVDDYLFVTDSLDVAHEFLEALSNYKNVNSEKTVINFHKENINCSTNIVFLGYQYNTTNLQVSRANYVYSGQMCFKIAFTNAIINIYKFLENRIGQSGIKVNGHLFNLHYNSEELVWKHIFTTFCLSANKFCTILAIICEEKEMLRYLTLYKKKVAVKISRAMVDTLSKNKPEDYVFRYCVNHFRYLSWKALLLCAKNTIKCSKLLPLISDEMAKCNCIFGKWRDHCCRVDLDGTCRVAACKEICRRTDLRVIMRTFDTLPSNYMFYNNKSRL